MNVIFKELFTLSHEKAYIEKYDELIDFEDYHILLLKIFHLIIP